MHSRFTRLAEQQPGRERRVFNVNRQHPVNGVIDAASVGGVPAQQILTGAVIHASTTPNALRESLGITDEAQAGPLAAFPTMRPTHAVYTTDTQTGAQDVPAAYVAAGTLPRMQYPLHNPEGFLTLANNGSPFIQKAATVTLRMQTAEDTAAVTPHPTRVSAPTTAAEGTIDTVPDTVKAYYGLTAGPANVSGGGKSSGPAAAATSAPAMTNVLRTK